MVSIYTYRCVLCAGTWFPLALGILGKILGVSDGTSCIKINSMSLKWSNAFEVCTPAGRESQRWRSKSSTVVFGRPGESTPSREFGRGSSFKNGFSTCVYCKHITTLKIWGCIQNYPSNCLITNVCIIVLITCCHKITTGYFHIQILSSIIWHASSSCVFEKCEFTRSKSPRVSMHSSSLYWWVTVASFRDISLHLRSGV